MGGLLQLHKQSLQSAMLQTIRSTVASLTTYKAIALEQTLCLLSLARLLALASSRLLLVGLLITGPGVVASLTLRRVSWWSLRRQSEVSRIPPLASLLALVLR